MKQKLFAGIVLVVLLATVVTAIHTAETRYAVQPSTTEQTNILFTENRYGQGYVKPLGGYGFKGASQGSYGFKGDEEGASNLAYNSFIPRGRDPSKISNYYSSARGYKITNAYVELKPVGVELVSRPQINGTPQGHARIVSRKINEIELQSTDVELRTRDLPPLVPNYLYEAWLVDEDTGYSMSIGLFQPEGIGRVTTLNYKSSLAVDPFDTLVVSIEPFPDTVPVPGQIILAGDLKPQVVRMP